MACGRRVPEFSLGLDYFDILLNNAITGTSDAAVFRSCPDGIHGPTCQYIHRGPVDPKFPSLPGPIVLVDSFLTNIGTLRVTGMDVNARTGRSATLDWGRFTLNFQGTYTIRYLRQRGNEGYQDLVNHEFVAGRDSLLAPLPDARIGTTARGRRR